MDENLIKGMMGGMVLTPQGLVVPQRAYSDHELQKAVQNTLSNINAKRSNRLRVSKIESEFAAPWRSTVVSQFDALANDQFGQEKRSSPNLYQLEMVSRQCFAVSIGIAIHLADIKKYSEVSHDRRKPGWMVGHKDHWERDHRETKEEVEISRFVENIIQNPDKDGLRDEHFIQGLQKGVREHISFDRVAIEPQRDYYGNVVGYGFLDGLTIKPLTEPIMARMEGWLGREGLDKKALREQFIRQVEDAEKETGVGLYERDETGRIERDPITGIPQMKRWVQVVDGQIVNSFSSQNLIVAIANSSPRINRYGYGVSMVEDATEGIVAFLTSFRLNTNLQSEGFVDGFLKLIGDFEKDVLDDIRDEIKNRVKGVQNAGSVPIISLQDIGVANHSDIDWVPMRQSNREGMFDFWLSFVMNGILTGIFQIKPNRWGGKELGTGGTALSEKNPTDETSSDSVGRLSIMRALSNMAYNPLIRMITMTHFKRSDFVMHWVGEDVDMTRIEEAQYYNTRYESAISLDETRSEYGEGPLTEGKLFPKDDPEFVDYVKKLASVPKSLIQPVQQYLQQRAMMKQQQDMAAQYGAPQGQIGQGNGGQDESGNHFSKKDNNQDQDEETKDKKEVTKSIGERITINIRKN